MKEEMKVQEGSLNQNIKKITILAKKEWNWKPLEKNIYDNILDLEFKAKRSALQIEEDFYLKFSLFIKDNSLKDIEQIKIQISSIIEMHQNLSEEAKLADLLENSEREKFKQGASNFFLVNLREQDTAASKAALMEMYEKYQSALADYKMAVFLN